jgi:hypothetical protein
MSKIAELNDQLRTTLDRRFGAIMLSHAVASTHLAAQMSIREAVKAFNAFNQDNDPRGEHDFGTFEVYGEKYCWKIDYCDPDLNFCSEDPDDPNVRTRLLTFMFADEYWQLRSEQVGF